MSGKIHFVTPTNRWVGSIPLSTIDPLTLEPLSTYVRPDRPNAPEVSRPYHGDNEGGTPGHNLDPQSTRDAKDEGGDDDGDDGYEDRTTNIAGQPVSLILARLQTTPRGCSCGCTVPAPPKHADYYHAQHLLRLVFLTQRIRSKALRQCLPQYFDSPHHHCQQQQQQQQSPGDPPSHTVISIDEDQNSPNEPNASDAHPTYAKGTAKPHTTPRYVHSLIQNRTFRNPLTNTEVEGDPTFFLVLEPGKGGWWYEPWAMAPAPSSSASNPAKSHLPNQPDLGAHNRHPQSHPNPDNLAHCQQRQHNEAGVAPPSTPGLSASSLPAAESEKAETKTPPAKTPEMIQYEKELRKQRWRQERTVSLEIEAQHELEWRRWQRSLLPSKSSSMNSTPSPTTPGQKCRSQSRNMRLRLGKDVALLEPSERGLLLPKRLSKRFIERQGRVTDELPPVIVDIPKAVEDDNADMIQPVPAPAQVLASASLEPMELEDIYQHHAKQKQDHSANLDTKHDDDGEPKQPNSAAVGCGQGSAPAPFLPWWDPDPHPFKMPITQLSDFAISTLPEPVARHFGGTSIYGASTAKQSLQQDSGRESSSHISHQDARTSKSSTMNDDDTLKENTAALLNCNMDGCKWVPVPHGDRVAVMIGTSKDFLLFPSFQRLFFRHLSREDFEDRVPQCSIVSRPLSMLMMEGRHAEDRGYRAGRRGGGEEEGSGTSRNQSEQSSAPSHPAHFADSDERHHGQELATDERTTSNRSGSEGRPWMSRILGRPAAAVSNNTVDGEPVARALETLEEPLAREQSCPLHLPAEDATLDVMDEKVEDTSSSDVQDEKTAPLQKTLLGNDGASMRDVRKRWELYWETFERENYDSSDYDYGSLGDEDVLEARLHEDSSDTSSHSEDWSEEDEDSPGDDGSQRRGLSFGRTRGSRQDGGGWRTVQGWMVMVLSCGTRPSGRRRQSGSGSSELQQQRQQRTQRRRARREHRWLEQQRQYQEQQSLMMHRRLPLRLQRVLGPRGVLRCSQVGEFCRFYLTILVAVTLMGAIVYAAVNVEGSRDMGRHDHRQAQAPSSPAAVAVAVATSSSRAVGGSTRGHGHDRGDQDKVEEFPGPGRLFRAQRSK
ncbi:hypothetical protein BGZ75_003282 [Mortierella antarctica]|nr:hypothetical protein BGZ75_003282 [Mortierella antarctica]